MLVLEPLNYTARYFMKLASLPRRLRHRQLGRPAPLCDIVNWQTSIYSVISEYLASLLDGSAPRLVLLWGVEFDSSSDWCDAHPELFALLRRGATTAMLWFEKRGLSRVMKAPWIFARLADPHLSDEIKKPRRFFSYSRHHPNNSMNFSPQGLYLISARSRLIRSSC